MIAFLGLFLIAFALLLAQVLSWIGVTAEVIYYISRVGECMAYLVTAICAYTYVRGKRNMWWWIAYIVAVVAIVVLVIL